MAVKVQRPHVREQVLQDLEALDELARVLTRFTSITKSVDLPRVLEEFGGRCSRNSITRRRRAISLRLASNSAISNGLSCRGRSPTTPRRAS